MNGCFRIFEAGSEQVQRTAAFRPTCISTCSGSKVSCGAGGRLVDLMIEGGVGVRVRKVLELHRIDEDFFLED